MKHSPNNGQSNNPDKSNQSNLIRKSSTIKAETRKRLFKEEREKEKSKELSLSHIGYSSYIISLIFCCCSNKENRRYYNEEIERTKGLLDIIVFNRFLIDQYKVYYTENA